MTKASTVIRTAIGLTALGVIFLSSGLAQAANYRLAVEPSFPSEQATEVYQPLADYLKRRTGHNFQLIVARNYHTYWRDLRDDAPVDFAFEEAHFADFRMQLNGFSPIARNAEPTVYALIASAEFEGKKVRALIGEPVACMSAPSLGFALLAKMYDNNPLAQPSVRSDAASWRDGVQMIFAGEVKGAVVPAYLAEEFYNLPTLARTDPIPGKAFTASPQIPAEVITAVAEALETLHEDPDLYNVLAELGVSRFVPATAAEYTGQSQLLRGFYGYDKAIKAHAKKTRDAAQAAEQAELSESSGEMEPSP